MKKQFLIRPSSKTSEVIEKFSTLTGTSRNRIICDFLDSAVPHLEEMIKAAELLKNKNPEGLIILNEVFRNSVNEVFDSQKDLFDSMKK